MKILLTIIISFMIFLNSGAQNVTSVDLTKSKFKETNAEEIFEDVKIIPLETHKDGLLKKYCTYYLTDKYIIAAGFLQRAYMFDRETGAFIREVSSLGQDPDEYTGFIYHKCGFDEKNGILFASIGAYTSKWWRCINIETNKMESNLKKPLSENSSEFLSVCAPWFVKNDTYVSFCNNRTGKDKVRLVVYRKDGTVIQ
ncbi:6-bladed beta-propeller [Bacteroides bouchesdurhonensis]|uniref:6-bladed beta-propeller n=1 Tax=Bacteroides bouchesdurhonensis TaxID=1841855 RepID=UPI0011DD497A|nr:6-bladed beta-propeller [Bacteroides bouchesdurhonensis]